MICLMVIAMVAGVMGIQVSRSLEASRFQNSVKLVKQEIEKLQMLALTFGSDMQLEVKREKGQFVLITRTDEAALKKLNGSKIVLKGVTEISWDDHDKVKPLDILANGRIVPKGVLGIRQGESRYYLDLRSPLQIKLVQKYIKDLKQPPQPEKPKESDETAKPGVQTG